jgi:hypothetical protein
MSMMQHKILVKPQQPLLISFDRQKKKPICFVTGVPGWKTLIGLNSHETY